MASLAVDDTSSLLSTATTSLDRHAHPQQAGSMRMTSSRKSSTLGKPCIIVL